MIPISRNEPFSEVIDQTIAQRRSRILFEMSSASSVEERFSILAILLYPRNYGRYKAIQRDTGVMSTHWHHVVFNRQKLTSAMIQAFGRKWPEYIFWMVVGQDNNAVNNEHPSMLIDSYLKFHEDSFVKISL